MGKKVPKEADARSSSGVQRLISPIAKPLFEGKLLERSLKLLAQGAALETAGRQKKVKTKALRRGVAEVTKALRKGEKGLVFFASDVHPVDIIAHLPVLCENKGVIYGYLCDKLALGRACASTRPSAVIMVLKTAAVDNSKYTELYDKVLAAATTANPFFD